MKPPKYILTHNKFPISRERSVQPGYYSRRSLPLIDVKKSLVPWRRYVPEDSSPLVHAVNVLGQEQSVPTCIMK